MALFCGLAVAFCFVPGCIFALVYLIRLRRPWILRIYVVSAMVFTASLANILIYYGISDLVGYPELGRVENDKFFVGLDGKYRQVSGATYHRLVAYGQVTKAAVGYALVPFGILYAAVHLQAKWQSRRAFSERVEDHPRAGIRTKRQIDLDYAAPNQAVRCGSNHLTRLPCAWPAGCRGEGHLLL